jgi:hypothetical protein
VLEGADKIVKRPKPGSAYEIAEVAIKHIKSDERRVAAVLRIARLGHRFFLRWIGGSERTAAATLALTQLLSSQQYRIRRWQKAPAAIFSGL